jgi:hypothetical protein
MMLPSGGGKWASAWIASLSTGYYAGLRNGNVLIHFKHRGS